MSGIGRSLILFGVGLVIVGALTLLWGRLGLPSRLPGDFVVRRGATTFFFPLATSLLLSVALTILLNVFLRRR